MMSFKQIIEKANNGGLTEQQVKQIVGDKPIIKTNDWESDIIIKDEKDK